MGTVRVKRCSVKALRTAQSQLGKQKPNEENQTTNVYYEKLIWNYYKRKRSSIYTEHILQSQKRNFAFLK